MYMSLRERMLQLWSAASYGERYTTHETRGHTTSMVQSREVEALRVQSDLAQNLQANRWV
ncbi:hypothetical protein BST20_22460 [Mycobacterium branderi]|uniref:Uncharacterized protein n=1 Tax=Mycobacterium branderi TaxID=43348 RepID=A0AA91LTB9_9MYCO|nr:hypothetical protein BST20_22460 [Mycobacterium branderi]